MLPSPEQTWSHGTVSRDRLETALSHPDITAIEIDILMGYDTTQPQESRTYQAMACHPPQKESDLSVAVFWDRVLCKQLGSPLRHVKLDFKDLDSVRPTLASLRDHLSQRTSRAFRTSATTIFLNADIFPGPGFRGKNAHLHAKSFLELCAQEVCSLTNPMAFSFGFKVDYRILEPYSTIDSDALATLTRSLSSTLPQLGLVLALNARLLALDCTPFDEFLAEFPEAQILVWTGTGEPPIPPESIALIKSHFQSTETISRVGFDCAILENA
jgi:hypothetical protein